MKNIIKTLLLFTLLVLIPSSILKAQINGIDVPEMSDCDDLVQDFMSSYSIPGATFALAKDGKLVYMRSFGNADIAGTEPTQPYHLFRIMSLSKPITSIAIMNLVQNGQLNLNDRVFGTGGILQNNTYFNNANITDGRIYNITVSQLLEHSAGWNSGIGCFPNPTIPYPGQIGGCDPIVAPLHVSHTLGEGNPVSERALIRFLLENGLDFTPGTDYAYSNIGYLMLGEVIESITGMTYEDYVKTAIFEPLGICDIHLGKNLLVNKQEREGEYIGSGYNTYSSYGTADYVPVEYGGLNVEAMDAHGGWIATARDLVRLLVAVDGFSTKPDILSSSTLTTMTIPSSNNSSYAKGWSVNPSNHWWHYGALDGTASFFARTSHGYTWAIILNKNAETQTNQFRQDFDNLPWNCIANTSTYPTHDFLEAPTSNCSNITFSSSPIANSVRVNWSNGNGGRRILVVKKDAPITDFPIDGSNYSANSQFGVGANIGNNSYVVYSSIGNNAIVENLEANATYYFQLFEYTRNSSTGNYSLYMLCNSPERSHYTDCLNSIYHPNTAISSGTFSADDIITSQAVLNSGSLTYQAGTFVRLNPGFHAKAGSDFHAFINGCTSTMRVAEEENDNTSFDEPIQQVSFDVAVSDDNFTLRNYPNPFTGQTTIEYNLPDEAKVTLVVTDMTGKQIAVLVDNQAKTKGTHTAIFNGSDYPTGMYYYTIQAGNHVETQKMSLIK